MFFPAVPSSNDVLWWEAQHCLFTCTLTETEPNVWVMSNHDRARVARELGNQNRNTHKAPRARRVRARRQHSACISDRASVLCSGWDRAERYGVAGWNEVATVIEGKAAPIRVTYLEEAINGERRGYGRLSIFMRWQLVRDDKTRDLTLFEQIP
jgi:hypothetical protein